MKQISTLGLALLLMVTAFGKEGGLFKELPNGLTKNATLKLANRYYGESLFYSAAENYKLYLQKKPDDLYANYWMARALYFARDYQGAEKYFEKFYSLNPAPKLQKEYFKQGKLYYGMTLHRIGKYAEAKDQLNQFRNEFYTTDQNEQEALIKMAKLEAAGCDSAMVLGKAKLKIKHLEGDINNPYNQESPTLAPDGKLYYTSLPFNNLQKFEEYKNEKHTYLFRAEGSGYQFERGSRLPVTINEDRYFTGNGVFNADGSRFYFTKCLEMDDDRSLCNIFVSEVKNGKMQEPTRLPEGINFMEKFTTTHPAVNSIDKNREVLYYSSNCNGGKGGMDIWYTSRLKDGTYTEPKLMGKVNTVGDEVTPSYNDSSRTLYFSSNGHPGMGGYDVFKIQQNGEAKSWGEVTNMGKRLNTGADELYFSKSANQEFGYFVSNREGTVPLNGIATASDDIFYYENLKFGLEGDVKKKDDPQADMTGSRFNLYRKLPNGEKELFAVDSTPKNGNYFFKLQPDEDYEVEVIKPGFLPQTDFVTTKGLDDEDTLDKSFTVAKDAYIIYGKVYEDDSAKPYGIMKSNLLVYDIVDGQERLFREDVAQDSFYYISLPTGHDYKIMARHEGYFAGNTRISTKNIDKLDSLRADIKLKKVIINKEYRLSNILYEFDKATLTPESKLVLDTLYGILMENPSFEIELASHTDGKGAENYNLKLSQARAKSCVDYLISKGITAKRMIPRGYGMSKPIAPNKNLDGSDNPEGRALNRRTEFKIVKM
ncbi:MAG: OmpA family protein [Chitinophagales bacterium]